MGFVLLVIPIIRPESVAEVELTSEGVLVTIPIMLSWTGRTVSPALRNIATFQSSQKSNEFMLRANSLLPYEEALLFIVAL